MNMPGYVIRVPPTIGAPKVKKFYIRSAKHTGGGGIRIIYLPSTEPSIYRVGQFSAEPAMWPH